MEVFGLPICRMEGPFFVSQTKSTVHISPYLLNNDVYKITKSVRCILGLERKNKRC